MKTLVLACLVAVMPSLALAAYQNPVVDSRVQLPSGFVRVVFLFTGNAGEVNVYREYLIRPGTTAAALRNWIDDTKTELNFLNTAATIPGLQQGNTVAGLARVLALKTAKEVWNEKYETYRRYKDSGLVSSALTSEMATLKADLEATYEAGFINP